MRERLRRTWSSLTPAGKLCLVLALLVVTGATMAWALDGDGDGMSDEFESFFGLNQQTDDSTENPDGDFLDNAGESALWTDPLFSDTDRDGWTDGADSNAVSRGVIPWGDPIFVRTSEVVYTWPDWMVAAFKAGGEWATNTPAWQATAEDTNAAALNIEVDRIVLTNDVRVRMGLSRSEGATFYLDLYDTNGVVKITNAIGNILDDMGTGTTKTIFVPLETNQTAVGLAFRRGTGEVTVLESVVYVDDDGDGLDRDQEIQVGTSDILADTDGDGFSDAEEVVAMTSPLDIGSHPPTPPTVCNGSGAAYISPTNATLRGTVVATGCAPTAVFCYWGTADGGTNPAAWTGAAALGVKPVGDVSLTVTGLQPNTTNFYRFSATNSAGTSWAPEGTVFVTTRFRYAMQVSFGGYSNAETLTNFPVMIVLSNNVGGSGFSYSQFASPSGKDLRFTNVVSGPLNYEIDTWDTNGVSVLWVQVPLFASNANVWALWGDPDHAAAPLHVSRTGRHGIAHSEPYGILGKLLRTRRRVERITLTQPAMAVTGYSMVMTMLWGRLAGRRISTIRVQSTGLSSLAWFGRQRTSASPSGSTPGTEPTTIKVWGQWPRGAVSFTSRRVSARCMLALQTTAPAGLLCRMEP